MECDICRRPHDAQRQPFLCTVDARNKVYEGRMKQLELLLANETLQGQINQLLEDTRGPSRIAQETALAQQFMAEQKTDEILRAADKLREEIQAAREEIKERKARLARRRSDLAAVSAGLAERRAKQQNDLEKSISMLKFRWAQSAEDMAATRAFLCTEAVRLYGLKRSGKKSSAGRYEYHLGRIPIVDLTTMDSIQPEVISTSLAHIAHILILISHYLAIRLPAEITLPHRDYPRPTIFNLQSSYRHCNTDSAPENLAATASGGGRSTGFNSHVPRPRPLFIEKPLSQLSKEDPATYSFFLEGVTLLAYNIAWLCCSQGVSVGDKTSFEDICNMGRNLYGLLVGNCHGQGANGLTANPSISVDANARSQNADPDRNWFGRYSHGTTYYSLGAAEGTELIRSFKIPNPVKLADKLKKKLIGDAPAPDWEMLDDDAWREESVSNGIAEPKSFSDKVGRIETPRGSSNGWMKVKNRS